MVVDSFTRIHDLGVRDMVNVPMVLKHALLYEAAFDILHLIVIIAIISNFERVTV